MRPLPPSTAPQHNQLLAALPHAEWRRLAPHLRRERLELGDVLITPLARPRKIYFPETSIVSLLYALTDGESAEVAIIGRDGIVGLSALLSWSGTTNHAVVQSAGTALAIAANHLHHEFRRDGAFRDLMLRYTQSLLARIGQVAVCYRHHSIEQQFCRWILVSIDRLPANDLRMTQELIASMLGVRRAGVTTVARRLRERGIIRYTRGRIEVVDRARLEGACCECYQVVVEETQRLLPHIARAPDWYPRSDAALDRAQAKP